MHHHLITPPPIDPRVTVVVVAGFAGEETRDMWAFDTAGKKWEDWSAHRSVIS